MNVNAAQPGKVSGTGQVLRPDGSVKTDVTVQVPAPEQPPEVRDDDQSRQRDPNRTL